MIAIHKRSGDFSTGWIDYCNQYGVPYKEVDCFDSSIIMQLRDCSALLWHWPHYDFSAQIFARQLIQSVECMGLKVFPSYKTCWHYDDKVGQKYLLEAIGAPIVKTHIFYDKKNALDWIGQTTFPKVWKLRGGAGSQNVQLVSSARAARKLVTKSFGAGWRNRRFHSLNDRIWQLRRDRTLKALFGLARGLFRVVVPHRNDSRGPLQRDYIYFQDFIPGNDSDIRIIVIGGRAFGIKRMVREGDFKASGSGVILYEPSDISLECVRLAFKVTKALCSQSCAFDFVRQGDAWLIVEISYAFSPDAYRKCPGYWDESLAWHSAPVTPERFMLEDLIDAVGRQVE